ncbi:MAG: thioredoxin family protein [Dehalococcoidia bacterium]|nr:thioredoxin family protein [Dehalococcoidia bacterium]
MPIISDNDRDSLKREFRKDLKNDVTIRLFTQGSSLLSVPGRECQYCPQTQQLMEELTALSPKLHLEIYDFYSQAEEREKYGVERIPAIVLGNEGNARLKFYGIPMGYEFATILEDIKTLSRGVSPLTMDTRKKLRKVNSPVHIQVFVTPS